MIHLVMEFWSYLWLPGDLGDRLLITKYLSYASYFLYQLSKSNDNSFPLCSTSSCD